MTPNCCFSRANAVINAARARACWTPLLTDDPRSRTVAVPMADGVFRVCCVCWKWMAATARHNLALLYRGLGRSREAIAHWRTRLAECPDFAEAQRGLAEYDADKVLVG